MFPIPFNFPFRKKDGSLTTIDNAINFNLVGGKTSSDSDKKIKLPNNVKMLYLYARRKNTANYYVHCETVIPFDAFVETCDGNALHSFCFANFNFIYNESAFSPTNHTGMSVTYDKNTNEITPYMLKHGANEYDFEFFVYAM